MALESATYISDLVSTNPTALDPKSQGDDHLRLIKSAVKATFPNINAAVTVTDEQLNAIVGKQTIWVPAGAMTSRTTSGAAAGTAETPTNKVMIKTLDFDAASTEYAQFAIAMPKGWNESTVTFQAVWSHAATTTNFGVAWYLQGLAVSNDDALDAAFGTAVGVTDTGGTTDDIYLGDESSAITIAGTPAALDTVIFQVYRKHDDAGDTMAIDARLHGIRLYYTTDTTTDA